MEEGGERRKESVKGAGGVEDAMREYQLTGRKPSAMLERGTA